MKKGLQLPVFLVLFFLMSATHAQVPVEKDPFHKIVLENKSVRVLDLSVGGSDTTTTHVHSKASVVVFLTKASLAIQSPGEAPVITNVDVGNIIYRAYDEKPVTHKVWSQDGSVMRCIVIEMLQDSTEQRKKK